MWRSVRQTPQVSTRTATWPGPGSGSGASAPAGEPGCQGVAASQRHLDRPRQEPREKRPTVPRPPPGQARGQHRREVGDAGERPDEDRYLPDQPVVAESEQHRLLDLPPTEPPTPDHTLDSVAVELRRVGDVLGEVQRVLLDGDRLVVARLGQLEAYDVRSGALELQRPLPPGYSLADVSRGIALLQHKGTILLLRLEDGRAYTLQPGRGPVFGEIEAPGLYYSYATREGRGRLVFVPRSEIERRLG